MREFIFRAWESGVMYYQVRCGGMFDGIPTAPTVWNDHQGDWLNLTGQPHTVIMQYTGLNDMDGKMIYEGDILKCHHNTMGRVLFYDGAFRLSSDQCDLKLNNTQTYDDLYEYLILDSTLSVVGNIYENPELLKSH